MITIISLRQTCLLTINDTICIFKIEFFVENKKKKTSPYYRLLLWNNLKFKCEYISYIYKKKALIKHVNAQIETHKAPRESVLNNENYYSTRKIIIIIIIFLVKNNRESYVVYRCT